MKINTYTGAGMWSWLLQRITGLLLVLYLLVHMWGFHFRNVRTPPDQVFDFVLSGNFFLILLILMIYHGFNGVRVVTIDIIGGIRFQRWMFWIIVVLGLVFLYLISLETSRF
ncbi:MAG: hypothetical protein E4G94_07750 [ANME-2 cluster archaeon]|nr:MAG: hypothetical protein E4G94_07750 [ANME-2 cluster archaeon]